MKLIMIKNNLRDGLSAASRASGDNLKLPILKYALIEVSDQIRITATNLEIAITRIVPGKIIEKGKVAIPISTSLGLVSNIQSERLNLETGGGQAVIKTDNYEASIQVLPKDDFPIIPKVKDLDKFIEVDAGILGDSLDQVMAATQISELRPELNSVLLDFSVDSLRLAATDSFRLAEKTIPSSQFKTNISESFNILIPLKTSQELLRVIEDGESVKIFHDQNQVLFKTSKLELVSRLIEGNFPNYETIVPKSFATEAIVAREDLINALKLSGIFSSHSNEVTISISSNKKSMEIRSASQDVGENRYVLPVKANNELEKVGFNWRYLTDGLKALRTQDVFLGINSENNKPTIIKSPNEASYFYVVMPILRT